MSDLISVFNDTMKWMKSEPALKEAVRASVSGTRLYMAEETPPLPEPPVSFDTTVHVSKDRSFAAAQRLRKDYPEARIAVHNFASATNPGGGVTRGSRAQEECLCRCSTLYPALNTELLWNDFYYFHRNRHDTRYTDACIWTPEVRIIKSDTDSPERLPESEWVTVDILTCAAPNLRPKPNNRMNPGNDKAIRVSDMELLTLHKSRARHMLSVAAAHGDEVLVLGAFGCGAFQNNPSVVAQAYKAVLQEFEGRFRHIEFAVFTTPRDSKNYDAFKKALG